MKFKKEDVREKIVATLGKTKKLSDRSVDEMLDTVLPFAGEETELDDFVKSIEPMFTTANGNLIKEQADFVKDWETKNPAPKTPKAPKSTGQESTVDDVAATLEALLEKKLTPLQQELEGYRRERTTESIFSKAKEQFLAKNKVDVEDGRVKRIVDRVFTAAKSGIGAETQVDDVLKSMKSEFEDLVSIAGIDDPYIPAEASGGQGGDTSKSEHYRKQREELEKEGFIEKK